MKKFIVFLVSVLFLLAGTAGAALINVTPDMTPEAVYQAIESAVAGDEVVIAPGTYTSRIWLDQSGTINNRIIIRAKDPNNRPVFDYTGKSILQHTGRAVAWFANYAWTVQANYITIEDIIIKGAREGNFSTAGIYNGPSGTNKEPADPGTQPQSNVFRRVEITDCDDGFASTGLDTLVEDCYFHHNGMPGQIVGRHNVYVHGGSVTFLDTVFDMALSGQHINTRAELTVIENCEFGEMGSYVMLMNTPKADMVKGVEFTQKVIIKNSNISGVRHNGLGLAKAFALENGNDYAGLSQYIEFHNNTYVGAPGSTGRFVSLYRKSGHVSMGVTSIGNSYSNYGTYLGVYPAGESFNDPFYKIDVRDVSDSSLPIGSGTDPVDPVEPVEPVDPAPASVKFNMSWDQESTENLHGWLIWATTDQANWGTPQFISYAEGMSFVSQATLPVATEYFFRIRPVNILMEQGEGEDVTVSLDVPLPGPTTNFVVIIAQ